MSTTRKMLKAEVTQLREQLAATENISRTKRTAALHELEKTIQQRDEQIAALKAEREKLVANLDKANHEIDRLTGEIKSLTEEEKVAA